MAKENKPKPRGLAAYMLDFTKVGNMTLSELFGKKPVPVTALMKVMWKLIKEKELHVK